MKRNRQRQLVRDGILKVDKFKSMIGETYEEFKDVGIRVLYIE